MAEDFHITVDGDIDIRVGDVPELQMEALEMATRIADIARSTAPVDTGDYAAGIKVQKTKHGARVYAGDYKSAWIEFGVPSNGMPARFNLRRAVEAAGFKFRKGKR